MEILGRTRWGESLLIMGHVHGGYQVYSLSAIPKESEKTRNGPARFASGGEVVGLQKASEFSSPGSVG